MGGIDWQERGVSVGRLSLGEISDLVTDGGYWVFPAMNVESRTSATPLMTCEMFFDNEWLRRLSSRHVADLVAVVISKEKAPTEKEARFWSKAAQADWEEREKVKELAVRERVRVLTQKAKQACEKCTALVNTLKSGINAFDDDKMLVTDPEVQKQVVSLGLALESLAEVISGTIEALLNGDPAALARADQGLSDIPEDHIRLALKNALDALGAGHEIGFFKQALEEVFLGAFFATILADKGGDYAARVYEIVRAQKPKIPNAGGIVRYHERTEWMGFNHYVRQNDSRLVTLIPGEDLKKILLVGLILEFNERVLRGELAEMVLEDMGWRYKEPAAGSLFSLTPLVVAGLPPYSCAWGGLANRLGLVPKKAVVEFVYKSASADTTAHFQSRAIKGNAAQYLGLLGGAGVSLGHRPDLPLSPLIWLCWKKDDSGRYAMLAGADKTNIFSLTSVSGPNGELRMALIPVGWREMNPQIYGPRRRRVVGLLDNLNFIRIKNGLEREINLPQLLHDLEAQSVRSSKSKPKRA